jgi:hypothetical protein
MTRTRFAVDLTIECDPDTIEELFEALCITSDEREATITQYRYYVPKNEQEGERY